jgi:lycopene beta-cyclase
MALLQRRPQTRFALVERDHRLGGNHLWCFHAQDVPAEARAFVDPLVAYRYSSYEVAFPHLNRHLDMRYEGITSDKLHQVVTERVANSAGSVLIHGVAVEQISANTVQLADGRTLNATLVIDSRGPERIKRSSQMAYQKFVGLEVMLAQPRVEFVPRLMDATVPQTDGYRFFYTLPFAPDRFLVEDTYYSDTPDLDRENLRREILLYAERNGLQVSKVVREESGVLPLTMHTEAAAIRDGVLVGGYAGGWFHPTTGYSFPVALRLAMHVSSRDTNEVLGSGWSPLYQRLQSQAKFFNLLNRMLFGAVPPAQRWNIFERFYRLPNATIERFYAMDITATDRLRLVVGRPPPGLRLWTALTQVFK